MKVIVNIANKPTVIEDGQITLELNGEMVAMGAGDAITFGMNGTLVTSVPRWRLLFMRQLEIEIE